MNSGAAADDLKALDAAFLHYKVAKHDGKDVSAAPEIEALGCLLTSDHAEPAPARLWQHVLDLCALLRAFTIRPDTFSSILGVSQWFALLARPLYSVFLAAYELARRTPEGVGVSIPGTVHSEVAVFLALLPLAVVDFRTPYADCLVSSDATPTWGFGVSVAPCSPDIVAKLCTLCPQRGDYVRLRGEDKAIQRLGTEHALHMSVSDFTDVLSVQARHLDHSGIMEAHGCLLALQWCLRSPARHRKRMVILLDAMAVLFAVAKGRSSSGLNRVVQSIGAHVLAGRLRLSPLYTPTECMPSDGASRGRRRKPLVRRASKPRKPTALDLQVRRLERSYERLIATGMLSDDDLASASSTSTSCASSD